MAEMKSGTTVRVEREVKVGVVRSVQGHLNVQVGAFVVAQIVKNTWHGPAGAQDRSS